MRVIFAGGGTGGHLFPGIAVAEALRRRFGDAEIRFVGSRKRIEVGILASAGYELVSIPAAPFSKNPWRWPGFAVRSLAAYHQSLRLVRGLGADLVVALGGYAAYWPALAAKGRRIPVVALEQNVIPGKAGRRIAGWAYATCVQFPGSAEHFRPKANVVVTGNPVRREVRETTREQGRARLGLSEKERVVLVVGGSQGSHAINELVVEALGKLARIEGHFLIHQTGKSDYSRVEGAYQAAGVRGLVGAFFDEMPAHLAAADVVVGRAGATGIAEICVRGLPSILIPYPHAAEAHQEANARELASRGAAVVLDERKTTSEEFFRELEKLLGDPGRMRRMSEAARALGIGDAAERVVEICAQAVCAGRGGGER
ncbi:MAG: undecaprenyldiphospho-muramoylpentapeptide beta-N-acetylglucosaminyltransferase [Planctomycetota bacterium]